MSTKPGLVYQYMIAAGVVDEIEFDPNYIAWNRKRNFIIKDMKYENIIWRVRTYVKYGVWTPEKAGQYFINLYHQMYPLYQINPLRQFFCEFGDPITLEEVVQELMETYYPLSDAYQKICLKL